MNDQVHNNAIGWFEIYVDDMPRAKAFYEAVFERELELLVAPSAEEPLEMWHFTGNMNSYGAPGALVKMPGFPVGRNSVLVYFSCQDCAYEEHRAVQFGGKIETPKMAIGEYGFVSLIYDTEGNLFGLHSMQ